MFGFCITDILNTGVLIFEKKFRRQKVKEIKGKYFPNVIDKRYVLEVSKACYFVTKIIASRLASKFISFCSVLEHTEVCIYCIVVAWFTVRDNSPCIAVPTGSFPGVKQPGRGADPPPPSSVQMS